MGMGPPVDEDDEIGPSFVLLPLVSGDTGVALTFDAVPGATSYEERHRIIGGEWSAPAAITSGESVSGLLSATEYEFQFRPIFGSTPGPWSNVTSTWTLTKEIVVNGTFATADLTGWVNGSIGTGTASAATSALVLVGTNSSNRGRASQAVTLVIGRTYYLMFTASGSVFNYVVENTLLSNDGPLSVVAASAGDKFHSFVATDTSCFIRIETGSGGGTTTIDDVSIFAPALPALRAPLAGQKLFMDIDEDSDIDDVLDTLMTISLARRGECELIGTCVTSAHDNAASCYYAILSEYGFGAVPVGVNTADAGSTASFYAETITNEYGVVGKLEAADFEDGVLVTARTALAAAPDKSVTYITTGGLTSLSNLLDSPADGISGFTGVQLVEAKCRGIYMVAGIWPSGSAVSDMNATKTFGRRIFRNLRGVPLALVNVDMVETAETGENIIVALPEGNIIRRAWQLYHGDLLPTNKRHAPAQIGILAAVRGLGSNFAKSVQGQAIVNTGTGATSFSTTNNLAHVYLTAVATDVSLVEQINGLLAGVVP